jgi:hypothetical protein
MEFNTLSTISQSLPETFPFYGLGTVSRVERGSSASPLSVLIEGKAAVSFRLLGDPAVLLIVLFDETLDASMYSELGNILASKLCQGLSEEGEGDLMVTPPLQLNSQQLSRLSRLSLSQLQLCENVAYQHVYGDKTVAIETLILPITAEGQIGHA